jgi:hypothetical protein
MDEQPGNMKQAWPNPSVRAPLESNDCVEPAQSISQSGSGSFATRQAGKDEIDLHISIVLEHDYLGD